MTLSFLIDYIPQFMASQGLSRDQYLTEWIEVIVPPASTVKEKTGQGYYFLCVENAASSPEITVSSENGKADWTNSDDAISYIHQGTIFLKNSHMASSRRVKFLAAFPISKP